MTHLAISGAANAAMNPVVNSKAEGRKSAKRAIRVPTERMARIEFCFRKKNRYHPICRRPSTPAYSIVIVS